MKLINLSIIILTEDHIRSIVIDNCHYPFVYTIVDDYILKRYGSYVNFMHKILYRYTNVYLKLDDSVDDFEINNLIMLLKEYKDNFNPSKMLEFNMYDLFYSIEFPEEAFNRDMYTEVYEDIFKFIDDNQSYKIYADLYNLYVEIEDILSNLLKEINCIIYSYITNNLRLYSENIVIYLELHKGNLIINIAT